MSYQLMFQKAVELQQQGALNEAESIYRQILQTAPDNADVLNLLGLIAQTRGIHNEAVAYFYKALKSSPNHFPIYFNLAVSLGAMSKYVEAIEAYNKVLKLQPECKEAYFGLGNLYWQQNQLEKAADCFKKALIIDEEYINAKTNLAEITNNIASLKQLAEKSAFASYYLARRSFNEKDFANAEQYLQKANKQIVDDNIKSMLGETKLFLNKPQEALAYFYQAHKINPHNISALINIADLEADKQNFKDAEYFYKKTLEIDNRNLRAHTNYANMLSTENRILEALEEYRQAVIINPDIPEISYNLALILKTLHEYEQALDLMFHAFYMAPDRTSWSLNIAETLILFNNQAPQKAIKIAENWYNKMPENIAAKHLWETLNHKESKVANQYNRLLFDNFAPTYEQTLQNINYQVINEITALYAPFKGKILDLGCGTGLLAQKIKSSDNEIDGIDISANMLEIAAAKNIYNKLINTDLIEYLEQKNSYDLIIAADVFCYFGDLSAVIKKCAPTKLIFSVETNADTKSYLLQANGRYQHNPQYIADILVQNSYRQIKHHKIVLRQENGNDVIGYIYQASCS